MEYPILNKYQTPLSDEFFSDMPEECQQQFWEFFNTVPYIKSLTDVNRKRAKDLPRDEKGRIIVDIAHPHILEDMDYFMPSAKHYEKYHCYTFLKPNKNRNSEYMRWFKEEIRRCWEGYVRESDGEWVPGYLYWYMNYCRILKTKKSDKSKKKASRGEGFPSWWEGTYLFFHYFEQARNGGMYNNWQGGEHGACLARRGAGKSFNIAAFLSHDFILGEDENTKGGDVTSILAAYMKEYLVDKDGCLDKFKLNIDWVKENTQFPSQRLTERSGDMIWISGYKDKNTGVVKGTRNKTIGVAIKDEIGKIRGKRAVHLAIEEFGTFPKLDDMFGNILPCVEDGEDVFGQLMMIGTAGDKESDFAGAANVMYHPLGHHMYPLPNVYDQNGTGKKSFIYFFPAYVCRTGFTDYNGMSDVTGALKSILLDRYHVKYNSSNPNDIIKKKAEHPIVPAEALVKLSFNMFPSVDASRRISQLDNNPNEYDDVLVGDIVLKNNTWTFEPNDDMPIRIWPTADNKVKGGLEIYSTPEINKATGRVYSGRYIGGIDPYDNDQADSMSLGSVFILDLWTDRIVAEYTGRPSFADDFYEVCRKLGLYYNASINYENNKKGLFTYFAKMNCTHLLCDTLESLRDKQMFKGQTIGNSSKGTVATTGINDWARHLLRDWLLRPVPCVKYNDDGTEEEITQPNIFTIRNRALLQEIASYNTDANFDRISAMGMLMLIREEKMILMGGNKNNHIGESKTVEDPFFSQYDRMIEITEGATSMSY